jgi:hypothetical protein
MALQVQFIIIIIPHPLTISSGIRYTAPIVALAVKMARAEPVSILKLRIDAISSAIATHPIVMRMAPMIVHIERSKI